MFPAQGWYGPPWAFSNGPSRTVGPRPTARDRNFATASARLQRRIDESRDEDNEVEYVEGPLDPRRPRKNALDASDDIVSVHVGGPAATLFQVHSKKLASSSAFFQAEIKPEWLRGERKVVLDHESPEAFTLYSSWLYTGSVNTARRVTDPLSIDEFHEDEFRQLASAYVLGETILDTKFQDTILDALLCKVRRDGIAMFRIAAEIVDIIYNGTTEDSPARTFLVDVFALHARGGDVRALMSEAPAEFFQDLTLALVSKRDVRPLANMRYEASVYHHKQPTGER